MNEPALLIVTGASAAGKTSAVAALERRRLGEITCHSFDSVGVPSLETMAREFGGLNAWQAHATDKWIHKLASDRTSTRVDVLEGQMRPHLVRAALDHEHSMRAQIVLFDVDIAERQRRLITGGRVELATARMDMWAAYLRGQADALGLIVVDTSTLSIEAAADRLEAIVQHLQAA